jgi:hypothetical protein
MLMTDERFNANLILRYPYDNERTDELWLGARIQGVLGGSRPITTTLGVLGRNLLLSDGRSFSWQQQGQHSMAWQWRSWRASSMLCFVAWPILDWA